MTNDGQFSFRFDWEYADESVRAPELRATWARLEIRAGDSTVTLAEDLTTGSTRRSVVVSLYPLAEWIAYNWWLLRFDGRDGDLGRHVRRRNLRSAGDGFLWPDVEIVPSGDLTWLRWRPTPARPTATVRFLARGQSWALASELQRTFADIVDAVVVRLVEAGVRDTPLQKEWATLSALDADERAFCEASARLGLDPFSEGVDLSDEIQRAAAAVDPQLHAQFFDAVRPNALANSVDWLGAALAAARNTHVKRTSEFDPHLVVQAVSQVEGRAVAGKTRPWAIGYAAARAVRSELGLEPSRPIDGLPVDIGVRPNDSRAFTGVGTIVRPGELANVVVHRAMADPSQRFAAARALWHAATTSEGDSYLLTGARSTQQQIGRSFAAELLAPAEGIRSILDVEPESAAPEDLTAVAEHFRASGMVISHQVENHLSHT